MFVKLASSAPSWEIILSGFPIPQIDGIPLECINISYASEEVRVYLNSNGDICTTSSFKPNSIGSNIGMSLTYIAK